MSAAVVVVGCGGGSGGVTASSPIVAATPAGSGLGPLLASSSTLTQSTDWPTFAHDLSRTSIQSTSTIDEANVATLAPIWTFRSAAGFDLASPIEYGGVVYAVDRNGNLVAIDAATGTIRWQKSLGANVKLTPSVYDGHLLVGTSVNSSAAAHSTLFALDPGTGAVQWQRSINGGLHGSPVVVAGHVFVPVSLGDPGFCHPGGIYMFDESTGSPGINWLTAGGLANDGGAVWSPVTYDGERIYFGTGNTCIDSPTTANGIVAIETSTKFDWAVQTAGPMTDDDVGGGVLTSGGTAYVTGKNGYLYALDPASGSAYFKRSLGSPDYDGSYSTPAAVGNTLITSIGFHVDPDSTQPAGTQFGGLLGLDRHSGQTVWSVNAIAPFYNPPAIVGSIAFTTVDSNLTALDSQTGRTLWSSYIETQSRSQPIVFKDEVVAADSDGDLYAYALPTEGNSSLRRRAADVMRSMVRKPDRFVNYVPRFCKLR